MNESRSFRRILVAWALVLLCVSAHAGEFYAPGGVAIAGYDPVAYFTEHRAVRGDRAFALVLDGVEWRFANAANRQIFERDPQHYQPQYGGYCAFGVGARERKIRSDPTIFEVVDGRLYLNFNERLHRRWLQNRDALIRKADRIWPELGR